MLTLDKKSLREELLAKLQQQLATPAYESWIKQLNISSIDDNKLVLTTSSNLGKDWVSRNCIDHIKKIIHEITGKNYDLRIKVEKAEKPDKTEKSGVAASQTRISRPEIPDKIPASLGKTISQHGMDTSRTIPDNFNLKYTFENFVVGPYNKFCHAAAYAVAKSPAKAHNPLFIYGGVGLGKTHLMQAIGHYIHAKHPHLKIKYSSTEMFTNELINSIRTDKMNAFRAKYRQIDVLLLDDIQFIEGKETTQEEIFHTFNTLYESGKQVVMTSDRHPKNISTLTERLRSRFEWGIIADIQAPELETRMAILRNKAEMDNISVPNDVIELIATAFPNNIRELEGAMNRVVAFASINNQPLTVEIVKNIIGISGRARNLNIERIIEATGRYFCIESSEIKGQSRAKEISQARQVAIYLTREMTNSSFPTIGDAFGGRKHTTVLYSYEKMKEDIQSNKVLAESIAEITRTITADCL